MLKKQIVYFILSLCFITNISAQKKSAGALLKEQKGADFKVNYINFPDEAKEAFEYAVSIWEGLISSPVTIHVKATWMEMEGAVFAHTESAVYKDFEGAYIPSTFYPLPLAEKMAGKELNNPGDPDIIMEVNSKQENFYYGTDGNLPEGEFDFVTIIVHEMTHGLGFFSSMYAEGTTGSWGSGTNYPHIFDRFIYNGDGQLLIDTTTFENESTALFNQFTSDDLYFEGPVAVLKNGGKHPKLFAPSVFYEGSSIYHLDEDTYPPGDENTLMTPLLVSEVVHHPGPVVMGMFADIGWVHTDINHNLLKDNEETNTSFEIAATMTSDTSLVENSAKLHYSFDDFESEEILTMQKAQNQYSATIPAPGKETPVAYYISVQDVLGKKYTLPYKGETNYHSFFVGRDTESPVIVHEPVVSVNAETGSFSLGAEVTDNVGIESVQLEYLINDNSQPAESFVLESGTTYSLNIYPDVDEGDIIRYRIVTVDVSSNVNTTTLPSDGYYSVNVTRTVTSYENSFDSQTDDFSGADFSIYTPEGFTNGALHSQHPYESTGQDEVLADFITQLKLPVKLRDRFAIMTYDEIVLLEPADEGITEYTAYGFWDYAVVEASNDGGENWVALDEGVDARFYKDWFEVYNSSIEYVGRNINSTAKGSPDLFRKRFISLYGPGHEFQPGDEIIIRFRLFSDPFSNGWGWAIDNLKIQVITSEIIEYENFKNSIQIYPVPAHEYVNIAPFSYNSGTYDLTLFNASGKKILKKKNLPTSETYQLELKSNPPGIYFLNFLHRNININRRIVVY